MDLLGKAEEVLDQKLLTIIESNFAAEAAKDLMLIRLNQSKIRVGRAIQDRFKQQFETTVAATEPPGCGIRCACRQMKSNVF